MFELTKNAISKNLIIFKVFLKEIFVFIPHYQFFQFQAMFILMSLLNYYLLKKKSGKKNLVDCICPSNFEIIITLLVELIKT